MCSYRFGEPEQAATTICVLRCDSVHFYFNVVQRYGNSGNKQACVLQVSKYIAKTLPSFLKRMRYLCRIFNPNKIVKYRFFTTRFNKHQPS